MRRHDSEVISTTSSTSKSSERKRNRFSLRRIFYVGRSGTRTKSRLSLNSSSSAHSDYGFLPQEGVELGRRVLGAVGGVGSSSGSSSSQTANPSPGPSVSVSVSYVPPSTVKLKTDEGVRECPLCLMEHPAENYPEISTCYHRSCLNCLQMYLRIEITESRINIACPECAEKFHPNDIKEILQDDVLMAKYEDFMVRRVLVSDPDARWCPAPDCGFVWIS